MAMRTGMIGNMTAPMVRNMKPGLSLPLLSINARGMIDMPSAIAAYTNASTSTVATVQDFEGKIWDAKAGEIRRNGGRRVEQLLTAPDDFTDAAWVKTTVTPTANQAAAPDGTMTADLMEPTAADSKYEQAFTPKTTDIHPWRIAIKSVSGTFSTALRLQRVSPFATVSTQTITVTEDWQVFAVNAAPLDLTSHKVVVGAGSTLSTGEDHYVVNAMLEDASLQAVQVPSEFVSDAVQSTGDGHSGVAGVRYFTILNGNTVDGSGVVTEAVGAAISPVPTILHEGEAENLQIHSEAADNAAWSTSGLASVNANAAASPKGTVTMDELIEDSGTSSHIIQDNLSFTSGEDYTRSFFVKQASGARHVAIAFPSSAFSGGPAISFDLTNGLVDTTSGSVTGTIEQVINDIYRVTATAQATATAAGNLQHRLLTDSSNTFESYAGDGTSSLYVWGAMLNDELEAYSYIATTTVAVTRAKDELQVSDLANWWKQTEGVLLAEITFGHDSGNFIEGMVSTEDAIGGILISSSSGNGTFKSIDGTNIVELTKTFTEGTTRIFSVIWSSTLNKISINLSDDDGVTWQIWDEAPYDGAWPLGTKLNLFFNNTHINNLNALKLYTTLPRDTLLDSQNDLENRAAGLLAA